MYQKSDYLFYVSYALIFILAGIAGILWSTKLFDPFEAFLSWLLMIGFLIFIVGFIKMKKPTHGSLLFPILGSFLTISSIAMLITRWGFISDLIAIFVIITCIGLIILIVALSRERE